MPWEASLVLEFMGTVPAEQGALSLGSGTNRGVVDQRLGTVLWLENRQLQAQVSASWVGRLLYVQQARQRGGWLCT